MADPMLPLCLFCLEELKEMEDCRNVVGCGCEIHSHASCLQDWFHQKHQLECPICHAVSVPNPVQPVQPEIVIVHLQSSQELERIQRLRTQERCVGCCCLTILFWWIAGLILQFAF